MASRPPPDPRRPLCVYTLPASQQALRRTETPEVIVVTQLQPDKMEAGSALAPSHHTAFAVLWTATVIGNTGTYMRDVASA